MNRFLSNLGALLLSIVLAVAVWVVAVQDQNPIETRDFDTPVRVSILGPDPDLSIVGQPLGQVTLQVQAPRQEWNNLRAQDFVVEANLQGLGAGRHNVQLQASHPSSEVEVTEIKPESLVLNLEPIASRTVPVEAQLLGEPAFGYEWRSTEITPSEVIVTGPESLISQVETAIVEVALPGAKETVERLQPVSVRNERNEPVTAISDIDPRSVQVRVAVAQRPGYRDFSVRVPYTGSPALGYQITGIVVDPSLVTLRGSQDAFDQLPGYVETLPVEINGATDDVQSQVALVLPESVSAVGVQSVGVRIQIVPITGSRTYQVQPIIRGLEPGLTRTVSLKTVDLVVNGPLPILETLGDGMAQAILDLSGLGPGTHSVRFTPVVPSGVSVVSLLPEALDVSITELPTPTVPVTTTVAPGTPEIPNNP